MMYNNKFVVCIKSGGKVLRETTDLIKLPFGSEFSVLVKNLNSRRAKFKLHIDGQDVLDGTEIIVDANSEVEMKRFIRNGNMNEGNAFKFIERTQAIEDGPRGIKVDDGVVRVEFWFEKEPPTVKEVTTVHNNVWWNDIYRGYPYGTWDSCRYMTNISANAASSPPTKSMRGVAQNSVNTVFSAQGSLSATSDTSTNTSTLTSTTDSLTDNDVGITVPGSKVEQKFSTVYGFNSEPISNVVILRLVGVIGNVEISAPVTVKTKQKCEVCGHTNKATSKFCSACGAALTLL